MTENPKIIHNLAYILQDLILRIEKMPKTKKLILGNPLMQNIIETINYCHEGLQGFHQSKILASARFDTFKLLLRIAYEMKLIPDSIYAMYIEKITETGRMLGGWVRKN